jgi:hypothetical protein
MPQSNNAVLEGISKMPKGEYVLPMQGKRNRMSHRSLPERDAVVNSSDRTPNHQSKVKSRKRKLERKVSIIVTGVVEFVELSCRRRFIRIVLNQ